MTKADTNTEVFSNNEHNARVAQGDLVADVAAGALALAGLAGIAEAIFDVSADIKSGTALAASAIGLGGSVLMLIANRRDRSGGHNAK